MLIPCACTLTPLASPGQRRQALPVDAAGPAGLWLVPDRAHSVFHSEQVVDDILDITATTEELGKTAGKDLVVAKATYPSLVGLERSREVRACSAARGVRVGRLAAGCQICERMDELGGLAAPSLRWWAAPTNNSERSVLCVVGRQPTPSPACFRPQGANQLIEEARNLLTTPDVLHPSNQPHPCLSFLEQIANELIEEAKSMLTTYDQAKAAPLYALAEYIRSRKN